MAITGDLKEENQLKGILWMISHCLFISLIVIIAKLLSQKGYNSVQIVFFHSFIAFLLILPFAIKQYGLNIFKTDILFLHFLRSFLGTISLIIYFFALKYVNLNDARAFALLGPVISFIFGIIFLKELINNKKTIALISSLIGGIIIINPTSPDFHIALMLILLSMLMWSTIEIIMKKISKKESTLKQLLFLTGLMSLFSLIPAIYYWKTPAGAYEFSLLFSIGLLFCINCTAIFLAIKYANITTIMPFDFSGMVFTAILTYIIFGQIITLNTLVGSIIVFLSSLYLIYHEGKSAKDLAKENEGNVLRE